MHGDVNSGWSDAAYKLWGARLESTTAEHVREVWLDHHRFEGDAKIVGRFQLVPLRSVDVGPAHVTLQAGRVMRGQALLADGIRGEGDVTFERFDPRGADMERVLGKMKIDADLVARAPNAMAWVQNPPPDMDGELPWEARKIAAHIDHGAIAPPTHVEIFAPDGWLRKGEIAVAGSALVVLDTEAEETVVRADLTQLSASHAPTKTRVLGAGATIEMRSGRVQLGKTGFDDFDYRGAVRDGTIPALRAGQPFLGAHPPLVIEGGHAAFSAEGTYSPRQHTVSLRSQTRVQRFAFTHDKRHFVADVDADVRVGKFGEQASSFDFRDSHVSLRNVDVTGGFADTHAWSGEVKLAPAVLALDEHPRLDMRAAVEARDPNPVLAWVLGAGLPGLLESYTKMSPLSATARIVVAPELGAVTEVAARGGGLQAHGGYAKRGSRGRAAFHVELPPLSAGIAVAGDSVRVVPFADDAWLAHEVAPINADASASTGTQTPPATRAAVASGQVAR